MFRLRINRNQRLQLFTWLSALALLMRAVVPDGYMPTQGADGSGFIFQLCSTTGIKLIQFDFATGEYIELESAHSHDGSDGEHDAPCPYSVSLLALITPIWLEFFTASHRILFATLPKVRGPPQLHTLPPLPARGPPAYSA